MSIFKSLSRWNRMRLERRRLKNRWLTPSPYEIWLCQFDNFTAEQSADLSRRLMDCGPKISVLIPTYNPDLHHLSEAIESVLVQWHTNLELCIADDASTNPAVRALILSFAAKDKRIKHVFRPRNGHISAASNSAFELATGEFVALLDQDDLLAPHALSAVACAIERTPDVSLVYTDEDKINDFGRRFDPHFKPDWNALLLRSQNYICHLAVLRRELVTNVGGFRTGYEGAQDHDLLLRCIESLGPAQIHHVPLVLYHWRAHERSTAQNLSSKPYAQVNGRKVVQEHLDRIGVAAEVTAEAGHYRCHYAIPVAPPLVSIVMVIEEQQTFQMRFVQSLLLKTTYPNFELVIVDSRSNELQPLRGLTSLSTHPKVKLVRRTHSDNIATAYNEAIKAHAEGEFVCLVRQGIKVQADTWLTEMVSVGIQTGVGVVGARLHDAGGLLLHAGIILGLRGVAASPFKGQAKSDLHYMARPQLVQELSAVTGACMLTPRKLFLEMEGLDSLHLKATFHDVDYCLRVQATGHRVVYTPYAELVHHEFTTSQTQCSRENPNLVGADVQYMRSTWGNRLNMDPAYNPNLTLEDETFGLARLPRMTAIDWLTRQVGE
jgi:glycosyltransferase involved in cell wall biosynthesis